jgi:hypothetical protein
MELCLINCAKEFTFCLQGLVKAVEGGLILSLTKIFRVFYESIQVNIWKASAIRPRRYLQPDGTETELGSALR